MRDPLCSGEDQWTMNWSSRKINLGIEREKMQDTILNVAKIYLRISINIVVVDSYEWGNNSAEKREEIKLNTINILTFKIIV